MNGHSTRVRKGGLLRHAQSSNVTREVTAPKGAFGNIFSEKYRVVR